MRKQMMVGVGLALLVAASAAPGQESTHRVVQGDTLWDLSQAYWRDAALWPELWAVNPQVHNPHWIYPGEVIYLQRPGPEQVSRRVVRLPLEKLAPTAAAEVATVGPTAASAAAAAPKGSGNESLRLARRESLDYISSHRLVRFGDVENTHQVKETYGTGEDIELRLAPGAALEVGSVVSIFQDAIPVLHPVSGVLEGYYVEILGHMEVLGIAGDRGVGRILESYQSISDGAGLMPFRRPLTAVPLREAHTGIEGLILCGRPESSIFADGDVVFLDKGSLHGLESGAVLEVPVREGRRDAQGVVDLGLPLATVVVVTVEDKSAAGLIVSSRAALERGDRFVAAMLFP